MKKNKCKLTRQTGAARWKTSEYPRQLGSLLLFVAAFLSAGVAANAANILVDPGFDTAPIFSSWSAQSTESWSMDAGTGHGGLIRTGANSLWTQGLYLNGGAPAYYNMGAFQTIACAPGATFSADAWFSEYTSYPYNGGNGANGNSGLLTGDPVGGEEDCWVEVQFLDTGNNILADYKSSVLSPTLVTQPGSAGVSTINVNDPSLPTVTDGSGNIYLAWIHCVVTNQYDVSTIGPDTDPVGESVTNTLSNGVMTAPPGTTHVKYFLGLAQQQYQSGANFWDDCTLNQLGGPSASSISGLSPNGGQFFYTNTSLTFTVASAASGGAVLPTNPTSGIHVVVNGVDQSASLQFTGNNTNWNVSLPTLTSNALYNVSITVNNSAGLVTTASASFDTFRPAIIVPVETFDYNGGQFIPNPVPTSAPAPNSYFGLAGTLGVDMNTYNGSGTLVGGSTLIPNYPDRTDAHEAFEHNSDTQLPLYIAANDPGVYNVDLGYNNAGNWFNYTRNPWPSGSYEVFARVAGGGGAGSEDLNIVTSGYGTSTQTTNRLGEFDIPNPNLYNGPQGTDWSHYYWVPLTDAFGNLVPVNVPAGQQTLQLLSSPIANENVIDFLFVAFPGAGLPPSISNISPATGTAFSPATAGFSFTASGAAGSTVNNSGVHLSLNGADVTSALSLSGSGPINASYTHLMSNTVYTAVIAVTNTAGAGITRTVTFDTINLTNFYVKFIDYDFNGGSYDTVGNGLAPLAYQGDQINGDTGPVTNVDYSHNILTAGQQNPYRGPGGLAQEGNADIPLPGFTAGQDYDVGWFNSGDWANYTRNYPPGKYYVYGRLAGYTGNVTLSLVTSGQGTTTQTLQTLGVCNTSVANQGWANWNWCLLQNGGTPALVTLGGVETIRATSGGNVNANYFMLLPAQGISLHAVNTSGNVGLSFATIPGLGYSIWISDSPNGPWTLQQSIGGDGTVKTASIPTTTTQGYLKVTSP